MRSLLAAVGLVPQPTLGERVLAFLIEWGLLSLAVWIATLLIDGVEYDGWRSLAAVALILGLLNALLKPLLLLLSFPITVLTLGLFVIVINIGLLWLTDLIAEEVDRIHFNIRDFLWDGVLAALIISVVRWALGMLINPRRLARDIAP